MGVRPSSIADGSALRDVGDDVTEITSRDDRVLTPSGLERRAAAEVERAVRYGRPLTILVLTPGAPLRGASSQLSRAVVDVVRTVDIVGVGSDGDVVVLMPETASQAAGFAAKRLVAAACAVAPEVKVGLVASPFPTSDVFALLANARSAARASEAGTVAEVPQAPRLWATDGTTIVALDPAMTALLTTVERLALSDITVLAFGETGTGKELIARALHTWSPRSAAPFVALNCAAVPDTLLESELFGYERGAFSGANGAKAGLLESANGGTLFLDEIGEASPGAQAKLLRVLETRRVSRLGSLATRPIDIRVVAATNRDLEEEVERGRFRQDLFFRLCGAALHVPPLRERPLDVKALAEAFLDEACRRERRIPLRFTARAIENLVAHAWPGNVRELRNLMAWVAATVPGPEVDAPDFGERTRSGMFRAVVPPVEPEPETVRVFKPLYDEIRELERTRIAEALEASKGVRTRAAELIGIPLRTLVTKIKEYDLADVGTRGKPRGATR